MTDRPRIIGLETEYGCLVEPPLEHRAVVARIRDWIFDRNRYGLVDLEERDWDEPAGNGGFLFNGGRLYIDMGHLEYCTPECRHPADVVRYDAAGDAILQEAIDALDLSGRVRLFRNNIDHHTAATFGCHENYSLNREAALTEDQVVALLAFLTLRTLFTGAGRIGAANPFRHQIDRTPPPDGVEFQISQRADHIQNDFYEWVQHNRAIINTRDEPLADVGRFRRLHLIHGDTNVLPAALFLKVGSTRLMLDLLEAGALPHVALADAVASLKQLSRRPHPPWTVTLADGSSADALELLERFRSAAVTHLGGRDAGHDAVLDLWGRVNCDLTDPSRLLGVLDWPTKLHLLRLFRDAEDLDWRHPWMEAQDLEYHTIDASTRIAATFADTSGPWATPHPDDGRTTPPRDTRASIRSRCMRRFAETGARYFLDWDTAAELGTAPFILPDPFAADDP